MCAQHIPSNKIKETYPQKDFSVTSQYWWWTTVCILQTTTVLYLKLWESVYTIWLNGMIILDFLFITLKIFRGKENNTHHTHHTQHSAHHTAHITHQATPDTQYTTHYITAMSQWQFTYNYFTFLFSFSLYFTWLAGSCWGPWPSLNPCSWYTQVRQTDRQADRQADC